MDEGARSIMNPAAIGREAAATPTAGDRMRSKGKMMGKKN